MKIDSIKRGIVIDHIHAGRSMDIYKYLHLDELECSLARKDIIKLHDVIDFDLDAIGYIDPEATINIIEDGVIVEKKHIALPEKLVNVIHCKNPRCITSVEPNLDHVFKLTDPARRIYRCIYCDAERKS